MKVEQSPGRAPATAVAVTVPAFPEAGTSQPAQGVSMLPAVNPPVAAREICDFSCDMTPEERRVYELAIKTCGQDTLKPEVSQYVRTDLSTVLSCVKIIEQAKPGRMFFDGKSLFVNPGFLVGKSDVEIQQAVADAIVECAFDRYESIFSRPEVDQQAIDDFAGGMCMTLIDAGFTDDRLAAVALLAQTDLLPADRELFAAILSLDWGSPAWQEKAANILLEKNVEITRRQVAFYQAYDGHLTNEQLISWRQAGAAQVVLDGLVTFAGVSRQKLYADTAEVLQRSLPGLYQQVMEEAEGKDEEELVKMMCSYSANAPANLKESLGRQFSAIWLQQAYFSDLDFNQIAGRCSMLDLQEDMDPQVAAFYDFVSFYTYDNDPRVVTALRQPVKERLNGLITRLSEATGDDLQTLRAQVYFLVDYLGKQILTPEEAACFKVKLFWPAMPDAEVQLLVDYSQSLSERRRQIEQKFAALDLSSYSPAFKDALQVYLVVDNADPEVAELIADIRKLEQLKSRYEGLLEKAGKARQSGDTAVFEAAWEEAGQISEEAEVLRRDVRGRVREFDKEINERFFGDEGEGAIMSYGRENMARSLWSQGKILAGTAWDDLWDGGTTDYRFQLKDMVIDQSRGNEYALDDVFSISWNVHARLKGMDTILTPERCQLIAQFAAQYAVDPVLVAAIILAEQRDQSDLENVTDLVGGVFGYNTSVGVGQVTVSTAREIFPERFAGKADWQVVYEMRKDEVSIEAVAKYLSILQGEGEATLGRKPTAAEIGSRYTSSSFTRLAGEFGWGHIVELIYYEIGLSDKFKPMDATALSAYAVAYQKGQLPNTVQPDFNGWLIIEEGILQNEIPPASPFYAYWEEKFAELNALDYDNLSLEEQQCALKWLAQFEEQVRMLREISQMETEADFMIKVLQWGLGAKKVSAEEAPMLIYSLSDFEAECTEIYQGLLGNEVELVNEHYFACKGDFQQMIVPLFSSLTESFRYRAGEAVVSKVKTNLASQGIALVDWRNRTETPRLEGAYWEPRPLKQVEMLVVHHTDGLDFDQMYAEHTTPGRFSEEAAPYVAYHFVIDRDGTVIWANNLEDKVWHANDANGRSVGIALVGDFEVGQPTAAQLASFRALTQALQSGLQIPAGMVFGHGELDTYFNATVCPGPNLPPESYR